MLLIFTWLLNCSFAREIPPFQYQSSGNQIEVQPPKKHHFNLKAPLSIRPQVKEVSKDENKMVFITSKDVTELEIKAYVCDANNTYCVSKTEIYSLAGVKSKGTAKTSKISGQKLEAHFDRKANAWVNSPDQAFAQAKKRKLPLFVDFYGVWCPPCNQMDDLVLHTKDVEKLLKKNYVTLKMDVDSPLSAAMLNKYDVRYFPTYLFLTSDQDEIERVVGFREKQEFISTLNTVFESKNEGLQALKAKAEKGDEKAKLRLAQLALSREDFEEAKEIYQTLEKTWEAKNPLRENLFKARYGLTSENKDKVEILETWIKEFPQSFSAPQIYSDLADAYGALKQKEQETATLKKSLPIYDQLIQLGNSELNKHDLNIGDLYMYKAQTFSSLEDKDQAKAQYGMCVDYFTSEASKSKKFARGAELNKAYCLRKSERYTEAKAIFEKGITLYPEDFTFHFGLGRMLWEDNKDAKAAIPVLETALKKAYGTQRIRTSTMLAKALAGSGENDKALALVDAEIASLSEIPFSKNHVERMQKLKASLAKKETNEQK